MFAIGALEPHSVGAVEPQAVNNRLPVQSPPQVIDVSGGDVPSDEEAECETIYEVSWTTPLDRDCWIEYTDPETGSRWWSHYPTRRFFIVKDGTWSADDSTWSAYTEPNTCRVWWFCNIDADWFFADTGGQWSAYTEPEM